LALLALWLQLIAAFGHVHAPDASGEGAVVAHLESHAEDGEHSHGPDEHHRANACDLCTTLKLTGTAQAAPLPVIVPASVIAAPLPLAGEAVAARRHSHAQSRAPPAA
jgi:hypothetical protein